MTLRLAAASLFVLSLAACGLPAEAPAPAAPSAPPPPAPAPAGPALTSKGLGPIRIGMTEAEIRAAVGDASLEPPAAQASEGCAQLRLRGDYPGVILMLEEGRLTRIDLDDRSSVRTDRGVGVGATVAEVMAAYPQAVSSPHKYVAAPAAYLTAWTTPDREGTVFEVGQEGRVVLIHAGGPSIQYVEGCA